MSSALGTTLFVVALVLAVVLHEIGHLVTAKRFGMRADRFFVGFGPTVWSRRVGETVYGLKLLPLGGFVRILGMADVDERLGPLGGTLASELGATTVSAVDPARLATTLDEELVRRGTPRAVREAIADAVRARASASPTAELAVVVDGAVTAVVGGPERPGDLAWRLVRGDEGRFFADRPAWQRAVVLITGPVSHLVVAIAVLAGAYLFIDQPTGTIDPVVSEVLADSPAEAAGLSVGDRVRAVGDVASDDYEVLRAAIRALPGVTTTLTVERDGAAVELVLTPRAETDPDTGASVGVVGFAPSPGFAPLAPTEALTRALVGAPSALSPGGVVPMLTGSASGLVRIFSPEGLGDLFEQATGQEERSVDGAVSLVGAASVAGQVGAVGPYGLTILLALLAAVNVFFALFNLVPLPPFDGGHLAVLAVERSVNGVRRLRGVATDYRVDPRSVSAVALPVVAVLGFVLLATLWLDITAPIRLG